MSVGFIHGVMNTDNCAISGETIDFGPCAFMDQFHPDCVFSSIDRNARYAWGNQPNMAHWNLTRFAETLLPLIHSDQDAAIKLAEESLHQFAPQFHEHYLTRFREKLALPSDCDPKFIDETLDLLASQQVDFTLFFRKLTQVSQETGEIASLFSDAASFQTWFKKWQTLSQPAELLKKMQQSNPIWIPRNHRIEQAIQAAYQDDFSLFNRLTEAWIKPFNEDETLNDLEKAPSPEEIVHETFCGT